MRDVIIAGFLGANFGDNLMLRYAVDLGKRKYSEHKRFHVISNDDRTVDPYLRGLVASWTHTGSKDPPFRGYGQLKILPYLLKRSPLIIVDRENIMDCALSKKLLGVCWITKSNIYILSVCQSAVPKLSRKQIGNRAVVNARDRQS